MNLVNGKIIEKAEISSLLKNLPAKILDTLSKPLLSTDIVIGACEELARKVSDEFIYSALENMGFYKMDLKEHIQNFRMMIDRDFLKKRVEIELQFSLERQKEGGRNKIEEEILPLGVLFHIAAGNMDGLPFYTVIEGLLAGNINFLKMPSSGDELTFPLLKKLCEIEPRLSEYIYVFEFGKEETTSIETLIKLSDAVVVWGGDEVVSAIRKITPPNTKIIEWGHKLSFAYVTRKGMTSSGLEGLAENIALTNQLLCSSCQGIFLDTEDLSEAAHFCKKFLPVLESTSAQYPPVPFGVRAQNTLLLRTRKLEKIHGIPYEIYSGKHASLLLEKDHQLSLSMQFRYPWVKCLPHKNLLSTLRPHKNHLQSATLLCGENERTSLRNMLWRAGVVRITTGENMMDSYCGEPHDGIYPLRAYTRIASSIS